MRNQRTLAVLLGTFLAVTLAGCGATLLHKAAYTLRPGDVTVYGADFTHCDFWDSHFSLSRGGRDRPRFLEHDCG